VGFFRFGVYLEQFHILVPQLKICGAEDLQYNNVLTGLPVLKLNYSKISAGEED